MSHRICRSLLAAALVLTGAVAAAGPAHAADGTSNTIMFAEAVHVDPAHHQAGPASAESLSLNFTTVGFMDYTDDVPMLMEPDGTYWLR
jgi:hypothetical protein